MGEGCTPIMYRSSDENAIGTDTLKSRMVNASSCDQPAGAATYVMPTAQIAHAVRPILQCFIFRSYGLFTHRPDATRGQDADQTAHPGSRLRRAVDPSRKTRAA